ncbi:MAG: cytochrome c3 family protein [bacterium]
MRGWREGAMRRKVLYMATTWLVVIMVPGITGAQSDPVQNKVKGTEIPEIVVMKPPAGAHQRKFSVPFPHASHEGIDCTFCHHTAYEALVMSSCSAEGCHADTQKRKGTESFYGAFHNMFDEHDRSCLDCHTTRGKGPTSCKECHQPRPTPKGDSSNNKPAKGNSSNANPEWR